MITHACVAIKTRASAADRSSARPRPRDLSNAHVFRSKVVGVVGCFEPFGVCRVRQVQVVDGLAGTKPAEPAQKMNGTSILVERLYAG